MKRNQIFLFLFLLNFIYTKNLRFTSNFNFPTNILAFINYKLKTDNCIEEFINNYDKCSNDIRRKLENIRIFEYQDSIYGNFTFEIDDYFTVIKEILEYGLFVVDYHQKYFQGIIDKSYDKLGPTWSKINLIYHIQNKNLNLINIFQRSVESRFEIVFLIIKDIPINIKKKKSRPLIILSLSKNIYNPLKEYDIFLPEEVIDKSLRSKINLYTLIDFFDLSIMKYYNDKFGFKEDFEFPELGYNFK